MSKRCTNITVMYAGGMADLISSYVYYLNNDKIVTRLTNTLELNYLVDKNNIEVIISSEPLELNEETFNKTAKNKKYIPLPKITGGDHSDRPITIKEKEIRAQILERVVKRSKEFFKLSEVDIPYHLIERTSDLMDKVGSEVFYREFSEIINNGRAKNFSNIIAYISELPSLEEEAIKLANLYSKSNSTTKIIRNIGVRPGELVKFKMEVDWAINDSIADHAYVRWLERLEGRIDAELVDKAIIYTMSRGRGNSNNIFKESFDTKCESLGINRGLGLEIREKITELLSDPGVVFSQRKSNTDSSTVDRFNAQIQMGEKLVEFTLFPYKIIDQKSGTPRLMVKILSVLDRNHGITNEDAFKVKEVEVYGTKISLERDKSKDWNKAAESSIAERLRK
jgi:hypothetical protein